MEAGRVFARLMSHGGSEGCTGLMYRTRTCTAKVLTARVVSTSTSTVYVIRMYCTVQY